jgi:short-subunit dehydrogenase
MSVKNIYKGLSGSKILITGATDGLGFGISIALAEEGANVIAVGRDKKKIRRLI